jgi:hypothetical protein
MAHSSFLRLWSSLLAALGFYLGGPPNIFYNSSIIFTNNSSGIKAENDANNQCIDISLMKWSSELQFACESAKEQLKNIILVASAQGMFEDRPELWIETCKIVDSMSQCQGLMQELLPENFQQKESIGLPENLDSIKIGT